MSSVAINPFSTKAAFAHRPGFSHRFQIESALGEQLASTLLLRERAAPLTVPTGITALDALTGGLPRGALSEIAGPASSGRTGVLVSALAGATRRQEVCALVDASDSFDPASAAAAGVNLERLLWVRCSREARVRGRKKAAMSHEQRQPTTFPFSAALEQVLKVTDLLLQGGGFGMVALDLGDIPMESVRRVPLTSWFRFRRAVEPTATVLLLVEQEPCAKTCASLVLRLQSEAIFASGPCLAEPPNARPDPCPVVPENNVVSHAALLHGMRLRAEVARSWAQRKPPRSAQTRFELRTAL
ncbi:MAG TPA: hypothetical protein VL240_14885 [Candidatus Binatia bacterium]|nr:hypothetical protein [Candidatus Binatia bacterium]